MATLTNSVVEIRELRAHSEFADAVRLQREIWGFQDVELLPLRLFIVASKIGGQILGAFSGSNMIAFCLCIPGLKPGGKAYLHSHMLGVLPPYRNTGLGRGMKLKQREFALAAGVDLIEWTFDPLEIKNAFFNIERLGAIARRYVHNQYGTTSSHLHGGLPTDRLIAEWWIASDRVRAICDQGSFQRPLVQTAVSVPQQIAQLRREQPEKARAIQTLLGDQLADGFRQGLAAIGFEKTEAEGRYLLGAWPSQ
jgi:predicted GNAT superfamily acetyltransferase